MVSRVGVSSDRTDQDGFGGWGGGIGDGRLGLRSGDHVLGRLLPGSVTSGGVVIGESTQEKAGTGTDGGALGGPATVVMADNSAGEAAENSAADGFGAEQLGVGWRREEGDGKGYERKGSEAMH